MYIQCTCISQYRGYTYSTCTYMYKSIQVSVHIVHVHTVHMYRIIQVNVHMVHVHTCISQYGAWTTHQHNPQAISGSWGARPHNYLCCTDDVQHTRPAEGTKPGTHRASQTSPPLALHHLSPRDQGESVSLLPHNPTPNERRGCNNKTRISH